LNPLVGYDYVPDPGEGVSRETGFKDVSRLSQANPFEKSADNKEPAVQSAPRPDYT